MEQYFEEIAFKMEGYEDFEREAWSFKVCLERDLDVISSYLFCFSTTASTSNVDFQIGTQAMERHKASRQATLPD
jgi:hypothetical protein